MSDAGAPRVHLMQSRDRDPLFDGAVYRYAIGRDDSEILVAVRMAPIFVHLLPLSARQTLRQMADELIEQWADRLGDGDEIRVDSSGTAWLGQERLRGLLGTGAD